MQEGHDYALAVFEVAKAKFEGAEANLKELESSLQSEGDDFEISLEQEKCIDVFINEVVVAVNKRAGEILEFVKADLRLKLLSTAIIIRPMRSANMPAKCVTSALCVTWLTLYCKI